MIEPVTAVAAVLAADRDYGLCASLHIKVSGAAPTDKGAR
jgi:hypothetical protein